MNTKRRKLHIVHYDPNRLGGNNNCQISLCGRLTDSYEQYNLMNRVNPINYYIYCKICLDKYEFDQLVEEIKEKRHILKFG